MSPEHDIDELQQKIANARDRSARGSSVRRQYWSNCSSVSWPTATPCSNRTRAWEDDARPDRRGGDRPPFSRFRTPLT